MATNRVIDTSNPITVDLIQAYDFGEFDGSNPVYDAVTGTDNHTLPPGTPPATVGTYGGTEFTIARGGTTYSGNAHYIGLTGSGRAGLRYSVFQIFESLGDQAGWNDPNYSFWYMGALTGLGLSRAGQTEPTMPSIRMMDTNGSFLDQVRAEGFFHQNTKSIAGKFANSSVADSTIYTDGVLRNNGLSIYRFNPDETPANTLQDIGRSLNGTISRAYFFFHNDDTTWLTDADIASLHADPDQIYITETPTELDISAAGAGAASVSLEVSKLLDMPAVGVASASVGLEVSKALPIQADAVGSGAVSIEVSRLLGLQADGVGSASVDVDIDSTIKLSIAAAGVSSLSVSPEISKLLGLQADSVGSGAVGVEITRLLGMQADGAGSASVEVDIDSTIRLSIAAAAIGTGSVSVDVSTVLALAAAGEGGASVDLEVTRALALTGEGVGTGSVSVILVANQELIGPSWRLMREDRTWELM